MSMHIDVVYVCVSVYLCLLGCVLDLTFSLLYQEFYKYEHATWHICGGREDLSGASPTTVFGKTAIFSSSQWLTYALSVGLLIFFIYLIFYCNMHFIEGTGNQTHNISKAI